MGEFGKRNRPSEARRQARPSAARGASASAQRPEAPAGPAEPVWPELITKQDLKQIDKGRLPPWVNMSRLRLLGFVVLMPLLMLAALWSYAPEVVRDIRYSGTFTLAADLRATEGKCLRYLFLVTLCKAKLHSVLADEPAHTTSFMMLFRGGDGVQMVPVRSRADASAIGIRYAVSEVLLNRTLSLIAVTALLGWVWSMFVGNVRKGRYKGGPAHEALLQYLAVRAQPA